MQLKCNGIPGRVEERRVGETAPSRGRSPPGRRRRCPAGGRCSIHAAPSSRRHTPAATVGQINSI